ncbi:MAG TPA: winged helix-turn-helix domain-containing protein [Dehalococcoidia bacterium]|nr:winged helix-turn-helix domain-containing protein [Dehalococcoidia bacterium]
MPQLYRTLLAAGAGKMTGYMLTDEGTARFRKRIASADEAEAAGEDYKILNYLYRHGSAPLEDIAYYTGLSRNQVMAQMTVFLSHGLVEGTTV